MNESLEPLQSQVISAPAATPLQDPFEALITSDLLTPKTETAAVGAVLPILGLEEFAAVATAGWPESSTATNDLLILPSGSTDRLQSLSAGATVLGRGTDSLLGNDPFPMLRDGVLEQVREAAIKQWNSVGLTAEELIALQSVSLNWGDLSGSQLGLRTADGITIDVNAAGRGWFIDQSPLEHSEFSTVLSTTLLQAKPGDAAYGQVDLWSVVAHELGHAIRLGHTDIGDEDTSSLMSAGITSGIRKLPGIEDKSFAHRDADPTLAEAMELVGLPKVINSHKEGDQYGGKGVIQNISSAPNGEYVVTWASNDSDGAAKGIFAQRFNAAGVAVGEEFQVNTQRLYPDVPSLVNQDDSLDAEIGDLDGDGDLDAFVSGYPNKILINDGNGVFTSTEAPFARDVYSADAEMGDVDNDGDLDIVVASRDEDSNHQLLINNGQGQFTGTFIQPLDSNYRYNTAVNLKDFNGDGYLDAFIADGYDSSTLLLNSGDGTFTASEIALNAYWISDSDAGDIDGDGDIDIITAMYNNNTKVLLNDGNANFTVQDAVSFVERHYSSSVELGDLDGDGDLDAFVTSYSKESQILLNDGNGQFTVKTTAQPLPPEAFRVAFSDIDSDGDLDAFTASYSWNKPNQLLINDGDGNFLPSPNLPNIESNYSTNAAFGDLDGDGTIDILVTTDGTADKILFGGTSAWANAVSRDDQNSTVVSIDGNGDFIVFWSNNSYDGKNRGIYGQRFNAKGERLGKEFQLNGLTSTKPIDLAIDSDVEGNFTVLWSTTKEDGNTGIYGRQYDYQGLAKGEEFQVAATTTAEVRYPSIAMTAAGEFIATWSSSSQSSSNGWDLYAQRFGVDGQKIGNAFKVTEQSANDPIQAQVAIDDAGHVVITWEELSQSVNSEHHSIYAQRYNFDDVEASDAFLVSSGQGDHRYSTVAIDSTGSYLIAWQSNELSGNWDILARWFNAEGVAQGNAFLVTQEAGDQQQPSITMADNGNVVITWTGNNLDGTTDVYSQRLSNGATPVIPKVTGVYFNSGNLIGEEAELIEAVQEFRVEFSTNISAALVTDPSNWILQRNGESISALIETISYEVNASGYGSALIRLNSPIASGNYVLCAKSLASIDGIALDGDLNGQAGGDFRRSFSIANYIRSGSATTINGNVPGNQSQNNGTSQYIVSNDNGTYVATWLSDNSSIFAQVFRSDGSVVGDSFLLQSQNIPAYYYYSPYYNSDYSSSVKLGDLDGDADLDAFFTSLDRDNRVLLNDGTGRLVYTYPTSPNEYSGRSKSVELGDLDGDGDLDAIVANADATNQILLNNGAGQFSLADVQPTNNSGVATSIQLSDLDGDGDLDAFVASRDVNSILINNGAGQFTSTIELTGYSSSDASLGDLDKDGDLDVFLANADKSDVVLLNDGHANFTEVEVLSGDESTDSIKVDLGDLDGDGDLDAFVIKGNSQDQILLNSGSGVFSKTAIQIQTNRTTSSDVELVDIDGDGDLDAFVSNGHRYGSRLSQLFVNDGVGNLNFSSKPIYGTGHFSLGADVGDLNGDGRQDIILANGGYLNQVLFNFSGIQVNPANGYPVVAVDVEGSFVISWTDSSKIYAQRFDSTGKAISNAFQVNTSVTGSESIPAIAKDLEGNTTILWSSDQGNGEHTIYLQKITTEGFALGGEVKASVIVSEAPVQPLISMSPSGDFIVTWSGLKKEDQVENWNIYAHRFYANGQPNGDAFKVSNAPANQEVHSQVAIADNGSFAITWEKQRADGSYSIYAKRYGKDGIAIGEESLVSSGFGTQRNSTIAIDDAGNYLISWQSTELDSGWDVFARWYNFDGTPQGDAFRVNPDFVGDQNRPSVAISGNSFTIAWVGDSADGTTDVYTQRFSYPSAPTIPKVLGVYTGLESQIREDGQLVEAVKEIRLTFSTDIDAATIINKNNWSLLRNGNNVNQLIESITYEMNEFGFGSAVIQLSDSLIGGDYTISAKSLFNQAGVALDGDLDGVVGGDFVRNFSIADYQRSGTTSNISNYVSELPLNAYNASRYEPRYVSTTSSANGNYIVTWAKLDQDENGYDGKGYLYAQLFKRDGTAIGEEIKIDVFTDSYSGYRLNSAPSVVVDGNGDFVVIWSNYSETQGQRFDSNGNRLGDVFYLSQNDRSNYSDLKIDSDIEGNFVLVWNESYYSYYGDYSSKSINAQFYNAQGIAQDNPIQIFGEANYRQEVQSVSMSSSGEFVVTWASRDNDANYYGWSLYAQRFSREGSAIDDVIKVADITTSNELYSQVSMNDAGEFIITWESQDAGIEDSNAIYRVYTRRFKESGVADSEASLVHASYSAQHNASVSIDEAGNYFVTWQTSELGVSNIFGRWFRADGTPQSDTFLINDVMTDGQQASVTISGNNYAVVTWTGKDSTGTTNVYTQRFINPAGANIPKVAGVYTNSGNSLSEGIHLFDSFKEITVDFSTRVISF